MLRSLPPMVRSTSLRGNTLLDMDLTWGKRCSTNTRPKTLLGWIGLIDQEGAKSDRGASPMAGAGLGLLARPGLVSDRIGPRHPRPRNPLAQQRPRRTFTGFTKQRIPTPAAVRAATIGRIPRAGRHLRIPS